MPKRSANPNVGYLTLKMTKKLTKAAAAQDSLASFDYLHDPAWCQWIGDEVPDDLIPFLWIEDRDDLRFRLVRAARRPTLTCYAPASMFEGDRSLRDVHRELCREMWVYAAKKAGWPEPPPLPPYHETQESAEDDS